MFLFSIIPLLEPYQQFVDKCNLLDLFLSQISRFQLDNLRCGFSTDLLTIKEVSFCSTLPSPHKLIIAFQGDKYVKLSLFTKYFVEKLNFFVHNKHSGHVFYKNVCPPIFEMHLRRQVKAALLTGLNEQLFPAQPRFQRHLIHLFPR